MAEKTATYNGANNDYRIRPLLFSIVQERPDAAEGYFPDDRVNPHSNETTTKYVRKVPALEGFVDKIEWRITEGEGYRIESLDVRLKDGEWEGVLQLGSKSFAFNFLKLAENIDFSCPVEFSVWEGKDKEKKPQAAFVVRQKGIPIKWKYTRDHMGECPDGTQNARGKWDFSAQEGWLLNLLEKRIKPIVQAAKIEREGDDAPVSQAEAARALADYQSEEMPFGTRNFLATSISDLLSPQQVRAITDACETLNLDADTELSRLARTDCKLMTITVTAAAEFLAYLKAKMNPVMDAQAPPFKAPF